MANHRMRTLLALAWLALLPARADASRPSALAVSPSSLTVTATNGATSDITLQARSASGEPIAGITWLAETSFGSITTVTERSPGTYVAQVAVPPSDMPRVAIIVFSPQGDEGVAPAWAALPISVRTPLSARTEPRSQISARVGAMTFGPVEAARDGTFALDMIVPPGSRQTELRLVDAAGNETRTSLPVPVRPHDPLTVALDRHRITTDGTSVARVFAFAFDDAGAPLRDARPTGTASIGDLSAFEPLDAGVFVAQYAAPRDGGEGVADIEVRLPWRGQAHAEVDRIALARGLPGGLDLSAAPLQIVAGETREVALLVRVRDAAGNALPGQPVQFFADRGELSASTDRGDGTYSAVLAPPVTVESGSIEVKALLSVGGALRTPVGITVTADPTTVPTSWRAFSLITAVVTDAEGEPIPGEIVLFHMTRGDGTVTPAAMTHAEGQAFADFAADPTEEIVTVRATSSSVPSLFSEVRIEKRTTGNFMIVSRPAVVARGGQSKAVMVLDEDRRLLQDAILLDVVSGAPQRLLASADPSRLPADGISQAQLTAQLLDAHGNAVRDQALAWSVDRGTVAGDSERDDGSHESVFTAPNGAGSGRCVVTVSHAGSGLTATVPIALDPGPPARLDVALDRNEMPADGTSRAVVTATVTDASGTPIPGLSLTFDATGGDVTLDPGGTTDGAGRASATAIASMMPGPVTIVVTATESGLTGSANLTLVALRPERLTVSARPAVIRADGVDRSEILATVEDAQGGRLENEILRFEVDGQARLTSVQVRSNADGEARTHLSGTQAETAVVRVTPVRATALAERVSVQLIAPMTVTIAAGAPACEGAVNLTATATSPAAFAWDWTGDGVTDATGDAVIASLSAGTHVVTVTARDAAGSEVRASTPVTVLAGPVAVVAGTPARVDSGDSVLLDASASTGATAAPAFEWDLDGDGGIDATTPLVSWTAPDGLQTAVLTVRDVNGCSTRTEIEILFGDPPDLATTLAVAGAARLTPGETTTLRTGWANLGPGEAIGARVVLTLDGPATFDGGTLPAGGTLRTPQEAAFDLGTLAASDAGDFVVGVIAGQQFAGTVATVQAQARISAAVADRQPGNDIATASLIVERDIDLAIVVRPQPAGTVAAGEALTVTLDVTNNAVSDAPDAVAELSWDALLYQRDGAVTQGTARFDLGTVPARTSVTRVITGRVRDPLPSHLHAIALVGQAFHAGVDRNPADNTSRVTVMATAAPDLAVTLQANPTRSPALPGDAVEFIATWRNEGTTAAIGAILAASMTPRTLAGLLDNPHGGVLSGDELVFALGNVAAGASGTLRWVARLSTDLPDGLTSACNEARVEESPRLDSDPSDDRDQRCISINTAPDLVVTIAGPASAPAGASATLTVTVTNAGARASGVDAEVRLSGAMAASGGQPATDPLVIRQALGVIETGGSATFQIPLVIPCPQPDADPILAVTAVAERGGAVASPVATTAVAILARPDIEPALSLPPSARAGETLRYTLAVTNVGCAPCDDARVRLAWDASLAPLPAQPLDLVVGRVLAGASSSVSGTLDAAGVLPAEVNGLQVVAVATCTADAQPANDMAAASMTLLASPDVLVTAVDMPASLDAGDVGTATVHVRNDGATTAVAPSVVLAGPGPAFFASLTPASVTLADLPPGGSSSADFVLGVASTLENAQADIALQATVSCSGDSNRANDTATPTLRLLAQPDLGVTMTITTATDPPLPGDAVTVRLTVTSLGTTASRGGSLTLERDPSVLLATTPIDAGAIATRSLPDLDSGARAYLTFRFVLTSPLPLGIDATPLTATVSDPLDTNAPNDTATRDLQLGESVDLDMDVSLATETNPARAGQAVRLSLRAANVGGRDAVGVTAAATWDPALVASVTGIPAGGVLTPGRLDWPVGALASRGATPSWDVQFVLAPAMPAMTNLLNVTAWLMADPATNPENVLANNQDTAQATIAAEADLCTSLTATLDTPRALPGSRVSYDVRVVNAGSTTATGVQVTLVADPFLGGPASAIPAPTTIAASTVTWTVADLSPGASQAFRADYVIPALPPGQSVVTVSTSAGATAPEDIPAGCASTAAHALVVTTDPDLAVSKSLVSATETPARRGTRLTYEVMVTNTGNSASMPATLVDTYPSQTTVVSTVPAATVGGGTITWSVGSLGPGASVPHRAVLEVLTTLPVGVHVLSNLADVSSPGDPNPANDSASHAMSLSLDVDLAPEMTCVAAPPPALPGSLISCTGTVSNQGSYPATNARLLVDAGPLALVEGSAARTATVPLGSTIAPLGVAPFSFAVRAGGVLPALANTVSVTATAAADEPDADPADDTAVRDVPVLAWTDLALTVTATDVNGPPLVAGDILACTLSISNARGTTPAVPISATASYDAGILDLQPGGDMSGGAGALTGSVTAPLAPTDAPARLNFSLRVKATLPRPENPMTICGAVSTPGEQFPNDNQACAARGVALAWPDLVTLLAVSAPTTPAQPGQVIEYQATVENRGTTTATGITLVHDRDETMTTALQWSSLPGTDDGSVVSLSLPPLGPGATLPVTFRLGLGATMPAPDITMPATACASAAETDRDPSNDCGSTSLAIRAPIDAEVTMTAAPSAGCVAGSQVMLTLTASNQLGLAPATSASVTVQLPPEMTVTAAPGSVPGSVPLRFDLGTIAPGASLPPRQVTVQVASVLPAASNPLAAIARITHAAPAFEANAANDQATTTTTCTAEADLVATLTRVGAAPAPGQPVTWRASWRNAGTTAAAGTTLEIADDAALVTPRAGLDPGSMARTYALGALAVGATGSLDLAYTVRSSMPALENLLVERITLRTTTPESNLADNVARVEDTISARPDLWSDIALATATTPVVAGDTITATITHGNRGTTASAGTLVVTLDPSVTFVSASAGADTSGLPAVRFNLASVAPGATATSTVVMRVNPVLPAPGGNLAATSRVTAALPDSDASNDARAAAVPYVAFPDLVTTIRLTSPAPPTLSAGQTLFGEISVENRGTTRATGAGATVTPLEAGIVASAACLDGPCTISGGAITWSLGQVNVAPGVPVTKRFSLAMASTLPSTSNTLTVEARAYGNESESNAANNVASAIATVEGRPDLRLVSMIPSASVVRPGDLLRVDYLYDNVGSAPADPAELAVAYDATALAHLFSTGGTAAGGVLTFDWGAPLQPGTSAPERATFFVQSLPAPPAVRELAQDAIARERAPLLTSRDANPADNAATLKVTGCYVDVRMYFAPENLSVCMGSGITITADATPASGVTWTWTELSGAGTFSSTTSRVTTYFPPTTPQGATYSVRVRVADAANPACFKDATVTVTTSATCSPCGCNPPKSNVQYEGTFSRWDRFGDRSATQGENVAFRVRLSTTNSSRSGWLLGGPGNSRMTFTDGTRTWTGWLSGDIWIECARFYLAEFGPAVVPANMTPGTYTLRFEFVTRDNCGGPITRDWDNNNNAQRVQILAAPAGNSGITFTDWGPSQEP